MGEYKMPHKATIGQKYNLWLLLQNWLHLNRVVCFVLFGTISVRFGTAFVGEYFFS